LSRSFVIEAMMLAVHGELLVPKQFVEYIIPYTTIQELYELQEVNEPIMSEQEDDEHVKRMIRELIAFFEESFNKKKVEKALQMPWRKSPPLPINEHVSLTVIYARENAEYGETFDPIETELILTSIKEKAPLLTDQLELLELIIQAEVPIEAFDIEDFEFAVDDEHEL
jgi:hypothetical protein